MHIAIKTIVGNLKTCSSCEALILRSEPTNKHTHTSKHKHTRHTQAPAQWHFKYTEKYLTAYVSDCLTEKNSLIHNNIMNQKRQKKRKEDKRSSYHPAPPVSLWEWAWVRKGLPLSTEMGGARWVIFNDNYFFYQELWAAERGLPQNHVCLCVCVFTVLIVKSSQSLFIEHI